MSSEVDNEEQNYMHYLEEELERINEENPNKFFTRQDIMEHLRLPRSSPGLIVIRSNNMGTGFRRDCYIEDFCSHLISKEEFGNIIDTCSDKTKRLYTKKRHADGMKTPLGIKMVYLLSTAMLSVYLVLSYYAPDNKNNFTYDVIQYSCLAAAITLMILVTIFNYIRGGYLFKSYEQMVKKGLDKYFEKINREVYFPRGLQWYYAMYWIELRILPEHRAKVFINTSNPKPPLFSPTSSVIDHKRMSLNEGMNVPLPIFSEEN